jgi:hypothetical protein
VEVDMFCNSLIEDVPWVGAKCHGVLGGLSIAMTADSTRANAA